MKQLIEDQDGAPYPTVYAVRGRNGQYLRIPYSGHLPGSLKAAQETAETLDVEVVECQLVPVHHDDDRPPGQYTPFDMFIPGSEVTHAVVAT